MSSATTHSHGAAAKMSSAPTATEVSTATTTTEVAAASTAADMSATAPETAATSRVSNSRQAKGQPYCGRARRDFPHGTTSLSGQMRQANARTPGPFRRSSSGCCNAHAVECTFTHQLRCGQASRRARPPRLKFFSHAITIARIKRRSGRVETASPAMELHARRTHEQKPNGKFARRRRDASSNRADIDPSRRAHCRLNITRAADRIGACWQSGCGVDHASGMVMVDVIVRGPGSWEQSHAPLARAGGREHRSRIGRVPGWGSAAAGLRQCMRWPMLDCVRTAGCGASRRYAALCYSELCFSNMAAHRQCSSRCCCRAAP